MTKKFKFIFILLAAVFTLAFIIQPGAVLAGGISTANEKKINVHPEKRLTPTPTPKPKYVGKGLKDIALQIELSDHSARIWVYAAQIYDKRDRSKYPMTSVDCSSLTKCIAYFRNVPVSGRLNLTVCYYDTANKTILAVNEQVIRPVNGSLISVPAGPTSGSSYCPKYVGKGNKLP